MINRSPKSPAQPVATSGEMPPVLHSDDRFAEQLRGFGPVGILAILVILAGNLLFVSLNGFLVLYWAWRSHTPWRRLGYVQPDSWARTIIVGIVFGVAFKFAMKMVVMPLFGAPPINSAYHYLAGNRAALPFAIYAMIFGGGFGEETVYRGFLFERLGKLLGSGRRTKALIVFITSALFAVAHYSTQGISGAEQAMITGAVFGTIFALTERIAVPMIAHAAFDLTALAIIYLDLEWKIAHVVFK